MQVEENAGPWRTPGKRGPGNCALGRGVGPLPRITRCGSKPGTTPTATASASLARYLRARAPAVSPPSNALGDVLGWPSMSDHEELWKICERFVQLRE